MSNEILHRELLTEDRFCLVLIQRDVAVLVRLLLEKTPRCGVEPAITDRYPARSGRQPPALAAR